MAHPAILSPTNNSVLSAISTKELRLQQRYALFQYLLLTRPEQKNALLEEYQKYDDRFPGFLIFTINNAYSGNFTNALTYNISEKDLPNFKISRRSKYVPYVASLTYVLEEDENKRELNLTLPMVYAIVNFAVHHSDYASRYQNQLRSVIETISKYQEFTNDNIYTAPNNPSIDDSQIIVGYKKMRVDYQFLVGILQLNKEISYRKNIKNRLGFFDVNIIISRAKPAEDIMEILTLGKQNSL